MSPFSRNPVGAVQERCIFEWSLESKYPDGVMSAGTPTSLILIFRSMAEPEHDGVRVCPCPCRLWVLNNRTR